MEAKKTVILTVEVTTSMRVRDCAKALRDVLRQNPIDETTVKQVGYMMAGERGKRGSKAKRQ